jgi:hypothetical protein
LSDVPRNPILQFVFHFGFERNFLKVPKDWGDHARVQVFVDGKEEIPKANSSHKFISTTIGEEQFHLPEIFY